MTVKATQDMTVKATQDMTVKATQDVASSASLAERTGGIKARAMPAGSKPAVYVAQKWLANVDDAPRSHDDVRKQRMSSQTIEVETMVPGLTLAIATQGDGGTVPPAVDIAPVDPTNSPNSTFWNKLLMVPAARTLYDSEVELQVFMQGIWGLQYVALATHWMIKDEVSCMVLAI